MKKKVKNTKGITLIALVLTIIILLILAGVTIATLTGDNGILSQTQNAKDSTEKAGEKEKIQLEVLGSYETDGILNLSKLKNNIDSHIKEAEYDDVQNFPLTVTYINTGHAYTIDNTGNVQKKLAQLVTGTPIITLEDGVAIPNEKLAAGTKLKIEFTASIENGMIETVSPGKYENGKITHVTTDEEVANKKVIFTIECKSEGRKIVPTPIKKVNLKDYYIKEEKSSSDIKNDVKSFYGSTISNYSEAGISWKIFYTDVTNDRIFLISSDYVPVSKLESSKEGKISAKDGAELTTSNQYNAFWKPMKTDLQEVSSEVLGIFKATGYTLREQKNCSAVSRMLNPLNWTYFLNENYADYAIGGPTIEMWTESWNDMYPTNKIYCNNVGESGYYIGKTSNPTTSTIEDEEMNKLEGYNNLLYYNDKRGLNNDPCMRYLIASPSALKDCYILNIYCKGGISISGHADFGYYYTNVGFRPVIALKQGTELKKLTNGSYKIIPPSEDNE